MENVISQLNINAMICLGQTLHILHPFFAEKKQNMGYGERLLITDLHETVILNEKSRSFSVRIIGHFE